MNSRNQIHEISQSKALKQIRTRLQRRAQLRAAKICFNLLIQGSICAIVELISKLHPKYLILVADFVEQL